jgi:endonuclease YncB( thermonuclease family)
MPVSRIALASILFALASPHAFAAEVQGKARVIDAETIEIGDARIRLFGIDAPAETEACLRDGMQWNCGQQASWALAYTLAEHWVTCRAQSLGLGAPVKQSDRALQNIPEAVPASCTIGPGQDVAETLLRQGWARAEESSPAGYASAEVAARQARLGMWQ